MLRTDTDVSNTQRYAITNDSHRTMSAEFSLSHVDGSSVVSQYCWHAVQSSCLRTWPGVLSAGRAATDARSPKRTEMAASFVAARFEIMAVNLARRMVDCDDREVGKRQDND